MRDRRYAWAAESVKCVVGCHSFVSGTQLRVCVRRGCRRGQSGTAAGVASAFGSRGQVTARLRAGALPSPRGESPSSLQALFASLLGDEPRAAAAEGTSSADDEDEDPFATGRRRQTHNGSSARAKPPDSAVVVSSKEAINDPFHISDMEEEEFEWNDDVVNQPADLGPLGF